jgi:hypothetical protein
MRSLLLSVQGVLGLTVGAGIWLFGSLANASETAIIKYRFLRMPVSVPELAKFAQTGEVSASLGAYLKMTRKAPQEAQKPLTQTVPVNSVLLYRVLNTPMGEVLLDEISQVIHTPDNLANRQSLRSALVTSALGDNKINIVEILQNYPTQEVHVEGERLAELYAKLSPEHGIPADNYCKIAIALSLLLPSYLI